VNLILNASKFAPEGTRIDVVIGLRPGLLRVTVADRGPGIPPGSGALLFDAFYRAPSTAHQDGVGLGLAIVKAIVQAPGGSVGAEPRRGGGSRFWFELPTAA
jgi:two-component system sensor histidine kinase KdpD